MKNVLQKAWEISVRCGREDTIGKQLKWIWVQLFNIILKYYENFENTGVK